MCQLSYKWPLQFKDQVGKTFGITSCWLRTWPRTPTQAAHQEARQLHGDRCPGFLHLMSRAEAGAFSNEHFNHLITSPVDWFELCLKPLQPGRLNRSTRWLRCSRGISLPTSPVVNTVWDGAAVITYLSVCVCGCVCVSLSVSVGIYVVLSCYLSMSKIHWDILTACKPFPVCVNALWVRVWMSIHVCPPAWNLCRFENGFSCELLHLLCGLSILQRGMMETLITLVSLKSIHGGSFRVFLLTGRILSFFMTTQPHALILMYDHEMAIRYKYKRLLSSAL